MKSERETPALPAPGVKFAPDMLRRLEQLVVRLASARERREGMGRARISGVGEEFIGFRPYRPGEDLRNLDWSLYARLDRPYVRVMQREASERWAILLDASASMGVGPPGKLQAAAELASAFACIGLRAAARVTLIVGGTPPASFCVRKKSDLPGLLAFLEAQRAGPRDDGGLEPLLQQTSELRDAGRVFVLGDLCDVDPSQVARLLRRGREVFCVQILAPLELLSGAGSGPGSGEAVEWLDPEGGGRMLVNLDAASRAAYDAALEERLEAWHVSCSRHGIAYGCWSSSKPFEDVCLELLAP